MQNFTPIGVTVAEIFVTEQKKLTSNLISDKTHSSVAFVDKNWLRPT